jgi:hypothetical protein
VLTDTGLQNCDEQTPRGGKKTVLESRRPGYTFWFSIGERDRVSLNAVLVGMVFPRNDNIRTFTVNKIRSVDFKAIILRFPFTFQLFQEL